jgi:hypothetical protein
MYTTGSLLRRSPFEVTAIMHHASKISLQTSVLLNDGCRVEGNGGDNNDRNADGVVSCHGMLLENACQLLDTRQGGMCFNHFVTCTTIDTQAL